jgi:hypothetical protein
MRPSALAFTLAAALACAACGRTDIAHVPDDGLVDREITLADGEVVLVELAIDEEDTTLRAAFFAVPNGLTLERLIAALAMGEAYDLVLDTGDNALILEVDAEPRAWIWR